MYTGISQLDYVRHNSYAFHTQVSDHLAQTRLTHTSAFLQSTPVNAQLAGKWSASILTVPVQVLPLSEVEKLPLAPVSWIDLPKLSSASLRVMVTLSHAGERISQSNS